LSGGSYSNEKGEGREADGQDGEDQAVNDGESEEEKDYNSDDFEDAFDNQKDLEYFKRNTSIKEESSGESGDREREDYNNMGRDRGDGLRRIASFSNIIHEKADEEDEENGDDSGGSSTNGKMTIHSSEKKGASLFKIKGKGSTSSNGQTLNNKRSCILNRREKSYFEAGSVRNSARDEEFFNYFQQLLEEVIVNFKKQGCVMNQDQADHLLNRH
jgi:hypothetical protein